MQRRFKVVITDYNFSDVEIECSMLEAAGVEPVACNCKSKEEAIRFAADADGIIDQFFPLDSEVIDKLEKCKVIAVYGVGTNQIDLKAASQKGICVANVPDYCIDEVASHAVALMMDCARRVSSQVNLVRNGVWSPERIKLYRLAGKNVGIAGLGAIGMSAARKLSGFEVNILGYDPYVSKEVMDSKGIRKAGLEELLELSDFITVHMPLTPDTAGMFSRDSFRRMKPTAYFVNAARGGLVDEEALYEALKEGWIAGAALDVLKVEPPDPQNPLMKLENLILTPHMGWYSEEANKELRERVVRNVIDVLEGRQPVSLANRDFLEAARK